MYHTATPRDEGRWAYHAQALRCECPYPPNSDEARGWLSGWDEAEGRARG